MSSLNASCRQNSHLKHVTVRTYNRRAKRISSGRKHAENSHAKGSTLLQKSLTGVMVLYLNLSQPISTYLNLSQPSKYASASAPKSIDRTGRACLRLKGLALLLNCVVHCVHSVHPSEFLCWVRNWHRLHRSAETFLQQAGRKGFPRQ